MPNNYVVNAKIIKYLKRRNFIWRELNFRQGSELEMLVTFIVGNVGDMSLTCHKMSVLLVNFEKNVSLSNTRHFFVESHVENVSTGWAIHNPGTIP